MGSIFSALSGFVKLISTINCFLFLFLTSFGPGQLILFFGGWIAFFLSKSGSTIHIINHGVDETVYSVSNIIGNIHNNFFYQNVGWLLLAALILNLRWLFVGSTRVFFGEKWLTYFVYGVGLVFWFSVFFWLMHVPIKATMSIILGSDVKSFIFFAWMFIIFSPMFTKWIMRKKYNKDTSGALFFMCGNMFFMWLFHLPCRIILGHPMARIKGERSWIDRLFSHNPRY